MDNCLPEGVRTGYCIVAGFDDAGGEGRRCGRNSASTLENRGEGNLGAVNAEKF